MCTVEDLTELQRATFLLKKGYEIQKLSVNFRFLTRAGYQQFGSLQPRDWG